MVFASPPGVVVLAMAQAAAAIVPYLRFQNDTLRFISAWAVTVLTAQGEFELHRENEKTTEVARR